MANTNMVIGKVNTTALESPEDIARKKVMEEANEEFVDVLDKVKGLLAAEGLGIIKSRYKIGEILEDASKEENRYGTKFIQRMEIALGYERDVIYQSLRFRNRFTESEVEELMGLRSRAGNPLLWTHVVHLSMVSDAEERDKLKQLTLNGNWSPSQLLSYIQKKQGGKRNPRGGKPLARPKSLKGFVDQQVAILDQLLKRKSKVWAGKEKDTDQSFFDVLTSTPPEKVDPSLLSELEQLERKYETVSMEMDNMATELLKARKKVERARTRVDDDDDDAKPTPPPAVRNKKGSKDKQDKMEPALDV